MARETAITNSICYGPNVPGEVTSETLTADTPVYVESDQLDERTIFRVEPSAAGTVTIEAGTGYAGVNALDIAVESGKPVIFTLDSARYAIASGENAGLIKITSSAAGKLEALQAKV